MMNSYADYMIVMGGGGGGGGGGYFVAIKAFMGSIVIYGYSIVSGLEVF